MLRFLVGNLVPVGVKSGEREKTGTSYYMRYRPQALHQHWSGRMAQSVQAGRAREAMARGRTIA